TTAIDTNSAFYRRLNIRHRTSGPTFLGYVSVATGDIVLNEDPADYGAYEFIGSTGILPTKSIRIRKQDFRGDTTKWRRVGVDHQSNDGVVNLQAGDIVQDLTRLQFVTLQATEDINVKSTRLFAGSAKLSDIAIEHDGDVFVDLIEGKDIRLTATGSILGDPERGPAIVSNGDVLLRGDSVIQSDGMPLRMTLFDGGSIGGVTNGPFIVTQVPSLSGSSTTSNFVVNVTTIDADGDVAINSGGKDLNLDRISTPNSVRLETNGGHVRPGADLDSDAQDREVNVFANDLWIAAGNGSVGIPSEALGVNLSGGLTTQTNGSLFVDSTTSLFAHSVEGGIVSLNVEGDLAVRSLDSGGFVFLQATGSLIDVGISPTDPTIVATALSIDADRIGTESIPVRFEASAITGIPLVAAQATHDVFLRSTGDVTVAQLASTFGNVNLHSDGWISTKSGPEPHFVAELVTLFSATGGIGSLFDPAVVDAVALVTDTSRADEKQFLGAVDSVVAQNLNAGDGIIALRQGTFVTELIQSITEVHVSATLSGVGFVTEETRLRGGRVAPGLSPGILNVGGADFEIGVFAVELAGRTAGNGPGFHDQLNVTGTVTIDPQTILELTVPIDFQPFTNDVYVIIRNDGVDPVAGQFQGLSPDTVVAISGHEFSISYVGGDGNDVVLRTLPNGEIRVTEWLVDSSFWTSTFRDYVDGGFNDGPSAGLLDDAIAEGYPLNPNSDASLPWINIDRLKIRFSHDVGTSLDVSDFSLSGRAGFDQNFASISVPTIQSVTFDDTSLIATLYLSDVIGPTLANVEVFAGGIAASGVDLSMLDDESQTFSVLPGDSVDVHRENPNGQFTVNGSDSTFIRDRLTGFLFEQPGNNESDNAYFEYDPRADVNGDGHVNGSDSTFVRDRLTSFILDLSPPEMPLAARLTGFAPPFPPVAPVVAPAQRPQVEREIVDDVWQLPSEDWEANEVEIAHAHADHWNEETDSQDPFADNELTWIIPDESEVTNSRATSPRRTRRWGRFA
ncbi:hypothetical protein ACFL2H_12700, partial [Planctomycetota bacterium]